MELQKPVAKIAVVGSVIAIASLALGRLAKAAARRVTTPRYHPRGMKFVHATFGSGEVKYRLARRTEDAEVRYLVHLYNHNTEATLPHSDLHDINH